MEKELLGLVVSRVTDEHVYLVIDQISGYYPSFYIEYSIYVGCEKNNNLYFDNRVINHFGEELLKDAEICLYNKHLFEFNYKDNLTIILNKKSFLNWKLKHA